MSPPAKASLASIRESRWIPSPPRFMTIAWFLVLWTIRACQARLSRLAIVHHPDCRPNIGPPLGNNKCMITAISSAASRQRPTPESPSLLGNAQVRSRRRSMRFGKSLVAPRCPSLRACSAAPPGLCGRALRRQVEGGGVVGVIVITPMVRRNVTCV